MKKLHLIIAGLGLIGLASGCTYSTSKIPEIVYEKTSVAAPKTGSDVVVPEEGTRSEGGGDVITSEEFAGVPSPAAPEAPVGPAVEAEGVVDDVIEEGTPPAEPPTVVGPIDPGLLREPSPLPDGVILRDPPLRTLPPAVSCDEKSFAFVSKRDGNSNVYFSRGTSVTAATANTDLRAFKNIQLRPGSTDFAVDELAFIILRTGLGGEGRELSYLPITDAYTRSFVWNADGSKAAYLRQKPMGGAWTAEIRVVSNFATFATIRTIVLESSRFPLVYGKIAWWKERLVYEKDEGAFEKHLYVVDPETSVHRKLVSDLSVMGESTGDDHFGTDVAVNRAGTTLAYTETARDGRTSIMTCSLVDALMRDGVSTHPRCVDKPSRVTTGSSDSPAWSSDGRWLYFASDREGNKDIYRISALVGAGPYGPATVEERLTDDPSDDTSLATFAPNAGCE